MKKRYGGGKLWFLLLFGAAVAICVWLLRMWDTGPAPADREEAFRGNTTVGVGPGGDVETPSERASDLNRADRVSLNDSNGLPAGSSGAAAIVDSVTNGVAAGTMEEQVADRVEAVGDNSEGGTTRLKVTSRPVMPGGSVDFSISLSSPVDVSRVNLQLTYPGRDVIVGSARPSEKVPGTKISGRPAFGKTAIDVDFERPFRSERDVDIVTLRATISRRATVGSFVPLTVTKAEAVNADNYPLEIDALDGFLRVVEDLSLLFDPNERPPELDSDKIYDGDEDTEATPTVRPTPEPTVTPIPDRLLSLSSAAGGPGETVEFAVSIDNGNGLQGVQFRVIYDAGMLTFVRHRLGPACEGFLGFSHADGTGTNVAMAGFDARSGQGKAVLAYLVFKVADNAAPGAECALDLRDVVLATGSDCAGCRGGSGSFRVLQGVENKTFETPGVYVVPTAAPTAGETEDTQDPDGDDSEESIDKEDESPDELTEDYAFGNDAVPEPTRPPAEGASIATPTSTPIPLPTMRAKPDASILRKCDFNNDNQIDRRDLLLFLEQYEVDSI